MKKHLLLPFLTALLVIYSGTTYASTDPIVAQTSIQSSNVNLRGSAFTLGSLVINAPSSGKVLLRFDGFCISDSLDRIILAASQTHDWNVDNDNIGFQNGITSNRRSFSHSRIYTVSAGMDSFFAVAQNYVDIGGSGIASIYGSLTAEFFPDGGSAEILDQPSVRYSGNLRGSVVVFDSVQFSATSAGMIISHFDGATHSSPGDRIILATNTIPDWGVDDGNVLTQAVNSQNAFVPFSHTRGYTASVGTNTLYAVGQNYVQTAGTGTGYVYGNLSAEYFPASGPVIADMHGISTGTLNLRPAPVVVDSITIVAPSAGKVLVQFDGMVIGDPGDRIILAASDTRTWGTNDGSVGVMVNSPSNDYASFSHSRLYPVSAGSKTFYSVAQNYVNVAGSGMADIYGSMVVKYFPDATTGINDLNGANVLSIYPNPAMDKLYIQTTDNKALIELTDINGRLIISQLANADISVLDISTLDAGIYMVHANGVTRKLVKQ